MLVKLKRRVCESKTSLQRRKILAILRVASGKKDNSEIQVTSNFNCRVTWIFTTPLYHAVYLLN